MGEHLDEALNEIWKVKVICPQSQSYCREGFMVGQDFCPPLSALLTAPPIRGYQTCHCESATTRAQAPHMLMLNWAPSYKVETQEGAWVSMEKNTRALIQLSTVGIRSCKACTAGAGEGSGRPLPCVDLCLLSKLMRGPHLVTMSL